MRRSGDEKIDERRGVTAVSARRRLLLGVLGAAVLATNAAACGDDGGPRLDSVVPRAAVRNAMVSITGRRLCGARGDCTTAAGEIQLGITPPMVRAIVVSYSDTSAQIVIPPVAPTGDTVLVATVNDRSSNALDFEVLP
jgi:hypothetical protein